MTVAAQNTSQQIVAAAGQQVFPFAWRADNSAVVTVWVNDAQDGGFTAALNADQAAAPGGTVTLSAPANFGDIVTVERATPQTQTTALTRYGPFAADTITVAFDKVVMLIQELTARVGMALSLPRSALPKLSSPVLPVPQVGNLPIGWRTDDGGLHFYLASVPQTVVGVTLPGTLVKNEVPTGAVNSTDGSDGNGVFDFTHVPVSAALFDLLLDGVRQPPSRYARVGARVTFNAGFFPAAGSDIRADYFY